MTDILTTTTSKNSWKPQLKRYSSAYPDEDHVFIFDNAKAHTKRAEGSLSALKMPKGPSANFGVEVNAVENGKVTKFFASSCV